MPAVREESFQRKNTTAFEPCYNKENEFERMCNAMHQPNGKVSKTHQMVLFALFASLTVVMTLLIRFPIPFAQGYLNIGDGVVMLAALVMGPAAGFWVGSIGSALADMIAGYAMYMPFTFFIKGLEGYFAGWLFMRTKKTVLSVGVAAVWMATGYLLTDWFLYGLAAAIAAFPLNLLQGLAGSIVSVLLFRIIGPIFKSKFNI